MRKIYLLLSLFAVAMVTAVKSYSQISVTATAGTTGPSAYTTLQSAINAINIGTHQGAITITVTANTAETIASALNSSGFGGAVYTSILIKPAAATTPTIAGTFSGSLLQLLGADNVTIDGSNTVGGTTRDLTITNNSPSTLTNTAVIWLVSGSAINGATNNVIKNCRITGFSATTTIVGIASSDGSAVTNPSLAPNSNNTVQNNLFTNLQNAMYLYGETTSLDANWVIKDNTMTTLGFRGLIVMNTSNLIISGNTISGITNNATFITGLQLYNATTGANIFGNTITNINNTGINGGCNAIALLSNTGTNNNIYNNFISNVWSTSGNGAASTLFDNGYGILIAPNGTNASYNVHFNTVRMVTPQTAGLVSTPVNVQTGMSAGSVNLQNNILGNEQGAGATIRPSIYTNGTSAAFSTINYNDYYATSGTLGYIGATTCGSIALMQTNFGGNVNSITFVPTYAAPIPNLHLDATAIPNYVNLRTGTPILPSIATDFDLMPRSTVNPTMGAHELLIDTITYVPLAGTCATGDVTLNPVTIVAPTGIPTTGALMPRIYFQKNAGPWFSAAGTQLSGTAISGTWRFVISATAMGGVAGGDVISYYVIAQDNTPPPGPVVFASPGTGMVATDVNTVTTPPTTPQTYTINAVSLTGLTTSASTCFNPTGSATGTFPYTAAPGAPNQYTVTWSPAGPTDVTTFATLGTSPFTATIPLGTPVGTYTGILTIRNSTTLCTNTYTLTMTVNAPPAPIAGNLITCMGLSTILTNTTPGGTWSSGTPAVATVGATSGVVTGGTTAGTAIISYTLLTGCFDTAIVTVNTPPAAIMPSSPVICQTSTITLTNSVSGGIWGSLTPAVAGVDLAGVVTGIAGGTATITYATPGCNPASKVVTVNPLPALITGPLAICEGKTATLSSATPGGTWKSNNHAVDTVALTTGVVIAIAPGTALVSYTLPTGCARVVTTTVNSNPVAITGASYVCQGLTTTLTNTTSGGTWVSQFPGVASVTGVTGAVTGITAGSASMISYIVTATGCYATKSVTVTAPPSAISGPNVFCANSTATLLNLTPGGTWTTSNAAVATVGPISPVQGAVTGASNAGGTAIISYTTLACNPVTHPVTLSLSPSIITGATNLCAGTMTALGNTVAGGTWISSNPSVAPVSPGGVVTGLSAGVTVTITYALSNGCYTVAPIVVSPQPGPISGPDTLCPTSVGTYTIADSLGLWSSSSGAIATVIAATGDVTAVSPGAVNVSYTLVSGCYSTKPLFVRTPISTTLSMMTFPNIDTVTICAGSPLGFKATATGGGPGATYEWTNHLTTVLASGVSDTFAYIPTHGDYIKVKLHPDPSLCAYSDSAAAFINVIPVTTPSISIATATTVLTYYGQMFTFTSTVTNGGTAPTYQWFQNGALITGATNSTYTTPLYAAASFLCAVTGNAICASDNNANSGILYISKQMIGVQSLAVNNELSMAPNPNTGSFVLTGTSTEKELDLEISNMLGQVVFSGKATPQNGVINEPVALKSDIAAGTYILRVHSESTNDIFHFVVNK